MRNQELSALIDRFLADRNAINWAPDYKSREEAESVAEDSLRSVVGVLHEISQILHGVEAQ